MLQQWKDKDTVFLANFVVHTDQSGITQGVDTRRLESWGKASWRLAAIGNTFQDAYQSIPRALENGMASIG